MDIKVLSRQDVEEGAVIELQEKFPEKKFAVVSITDRLSRGANVFHSQRNMFGILALKFDDVEFDRYAGDEPLFITITRGQAEKAAKFLFDAIDAGVDVMIVHCEAGISRSAGMAGAFAILSGQNDWPFFGGEYRPNMLVYRCVLNAGVEDSRFKMK